MSLKRLSKRTTMIAAGCALALPIAAGSAYATLGADLPALPGAPALPAAPALPGTPALPAADLPSTEGGEFGGSYGIDGADASIDDALGTAGGSVSPDGEAVSELGSVAGAATPDSVAGTGSLGYGDQSGSLSGMLGTDGALGEFGSPLGSGSISGTLDGLTGEFCPSSGAACMSGTLPPG